jgi:hypothetical protein
MCFVLSWKTGFEMMWMAALLSQYNFTGCGCEIWRSANSCFNQVISLQVEAIYYASAEERDTVVCFFVFQDIGELPISIQYPVTERRVSLHRAQSASQNACN